MRLVTHRLGNPSPARGTRCGVHTAIAFMEEVAGVEQSGKLTGTQVYAIIQKKILANTLPSRLVKQAPRMLVGVISMLEIWLGPKRLQSTIAFMRGGFWCSHGEP